MRSVTTISYISFRRALSQLEAAVLLTFCARFGSFFLPQTIKHLSQPELPFTKQSSQGNVSLSKSLQAMRKFTKVEVLQMVDLNPKTEVELYVVSLPSFRFFPSVELAFLLSSPPRPPLPPSPFCSPTWSPRLNFPLYPFPRTCPFSRKASRPSFHLSKPDSLPSSRPPQIIEELYTRLTPEEITETLYLVKTSLSSSSFPSSTDPSSKINSRAAPNGFGTMEGDDDADQDELDDWGGGQEYDEDAQGPEDMGFEQDEERDVD